MIRDIRYLASLSEPGLDLYRTLRRPLAHREQGLFVAEGNKVVCRLLESTLQTLSILLTPDWFNLLRTIIENRPESIDLFIAEKPLLESIVGIECHQGVMAVAKVPPELTIDAIAAASPGPRLFVAVDHLTSAENSGVLVRNCAACGAQALIAGETSADPWLRRSVRNSMGTIFRLPILYSEKLSATLGRLRRDFGFRIVAAHPRPDSITLSDADFRRDCCIVFGNEGEGVSDTVLQECDTAVAIPMASGIDSFNVSCAGAVVMYEAMRQRRKSNGEVIE